MGKHVGAMSPGEGTPDPAGEEPVLRLGHKRFTFGSYIKKALEKLVFPSVTDLMLHHQGHFIIHGYCNLVTSLGSSSKVNIKVFVDE